MADSDWRDEVLDTLSGFVATVRPHYDFLVRDFQFHPPVAKSLGLVHLVRYEGPRTMVQLAWDTRERSFSSDLIRRLASGESEIDDRRWLSPNDILAVKGAQGRWVTADDWEQADERQFQRCLARDAKNMRDFCGDVLRGDWGIAREVEEWHQQVRDRRTSTGQSKN